ncbi:hypothetical protein N9M66_00675 [Litoreibacter sp.]|nr:hypothetical protein [Litoreibacter sp.]
MLFIGVLWGGICQAWAQAIVKSGEHETFSRLVVFLPKAQTWDLRKTETGYEIVVDKWTEGFDISTVFDLIPRTRIASLRAEGAKLELVLDCDCDAAASPLDTGGLVVDVENAKPVARAENPSLVETPTLKLPTQTSNQVAISDVHLRPSNPDAEHPDLEPFRRSLMQNLGRSASLSLVELDVERRVSGKGDTPAKKTTKASDEDLKLFEESGRLRITTAMDAALTDKSQKPKDPQIAECPDASRFDIADWGGDDPFGDQIGLLRQDIMGEFDVPDLAAARSLVRLYVYFGLGVEAKIIVDQFNFSLAEKSELQAISNILEPSSYSDNTQSVFPTNCGPKIAIWAVFQNQSTASISDTEIKAVLAEFAAWPAHLRSQLGASLFSAMNLGGAEEAASVVGSVLARSGDETSTELTLGSARRSDHAAYTSDELLKIINDGGEKAPEALVFFLGRQIDEDQRIDPNWIILAAAFAKELSGLPMSNDLSNARARALAYSGEFSAAFQAYRDAGKNGWSAEPRLADDLAEYFVEGADQNDMVRFVLFLIAEDQAKTLNPVNLEALIRRLMADGLPELAESLFSHMPNSQSPKALAADIAGKTNKVDQAVAMYRDLDDEGTVLKRVDLMLNNGRADDIWTELGDGLTGEVREQVAWAASQWAAIGDEGPKGQVATLMAEIPKVDLAEAPLTGAELLQERSKSTRSAVAALLGIVTP